LVTLPYYQSAFTKGRGKGRKAAGPTIKFSTSPDDLLREDAFCFIPAAPIANYLDTDPYSHASMVTEHMGNWSMIVEGANTYSPDPSRKAARARMERAVYRQRGIIIATDYLVNSGGVIFAAQEHLIKTPDTLRIPDEMLGDAEAVADWLDERAAELSALAEKRVIAAEKSRDEVIRRNMRELVDLLVTDADMLPCEAAESISIRRITSREQDRTAKDIMERLITIPIESNIQDAAHLLVEAGSPILAVVMPSGALAGVVTDWDITRAAALGLKMEDSIRTIMTRQVISAAPGDSILEIVRKLEYYEISSMPVVEGETVLGMVGTDILARRSLYRLLQTQMNE
jgi:CBS domain-containing protein